MKVIDCHDLPNYFTTWTSQPCEDIEFVPKLLGDFDLWVRF